MTRLPQTAERVSESFGLGALLALVGGFLDAYTYCARGGVFANSQTGNMALLGISLIVRDRDVVLNYLTPIVSYALGVLISEINHSHLRGKSLYWRQGTILAELLLVGLVAVIPSDLNMLANALVSMLCAIQTQSFRRVHGTSYVTTTCSGNLRNAVKLFYRFFRSKKRALGRRAAIYSGIILIFISGAMLGTFCSIRWGTKAILVCMIPLFIVFLLLSHVRSRTSAKKQ